MPLSLVAKGETKIISELNGKEEIRKRLLDIGFIKGTSITVTDINPSGLVVVIKGCKIAIDRSLANKIIVSDQ